MLGVLQAEVSAPTFIFGAFTATLRITLEVCTSPIKTKPMSVLRYEAHETCQAITCIFLRKNLSIKQYQKLSGLSC